MQATKWPRLAARLCLSIGMLSGLAGVSRADGEELGPGSLSGINSSALPSPVNTGEAVIPAQVNEFSYTFSGTVLIRVPRSVSKATRNGSFVQLENPARLRAEFTGTYTSRSKGKQKVRFRLQLFSGASTSNRTPLEAPCESEGAEHEIEPGASFDFRPKGGPFRLLPADL